MIKLTFLGDIMCDYNMSKRLDVYRCENGKYDFRSVFSHVKPLLEQSDYVFANLETPISADHSDLTKLKWTFNSPIEFAAAVKDAGVDFVSTANNHCLDRGVEGLRSTIQCLNAIGLEHCGINIGTDQNFRIVEVGGIRIGVVAYTYGTNAFSNHQFLSWKNRKAVNLLQEQEGRVKQIWSSVFHGHLKWLYQKLERLFFPANQSMQIYEKRTISLYRRWLIKRDLRCVKKEKPDFLVALLHVGGQYNKQPSVFTKQVTNWFVKHGCDIVVDNHEHVVHGLKIQNGKIAAYALGNCLGSAGVTKEPFDRYCEYSVAFHVYCDTERKKVDHVTFDLLRTIEAESGSYEVWNCSDLLSQSEYDENGMNLMKDIQTVSNVFGKV